MVLPGNDQVAMKNARKIFYGGHFWADHPVLHCGNIFDLFGWHSEVS